MWIKARRIILAEFPITEVACIRLKISFHPRSKLFYFMSLISFAIDNCQCSDYYYFSLIKLYNCQITWHFLFKYVLYFCIKLLQAVCYTVTLCLYTLHWTFRLSCSVLSMAWLNHICPCCSLDFHVTLSYKM